MTTIKQLYLGIIAVGNLLQSLFLLAIRVFWGWEFFQAGLSKFLDITTVGGYFESMGIIFPYFSAYAVAFTEFVGGAMLLVGFGTRLAGIALMVVMTVALFLTFPDAYNALFNDPATLMTQTPFTFLLASLILFLFGPGIVSVDALIKRFIGRKPIE